MPSFPKETELVRRTAETLLACPVSRLEGVRGGGNNRLYRASTASGPVAVKCYFRHESDTRDRQAAEFMALEFLGRHGVEVVPRALAQCRQTGIAVYSWVEGLAISGRLPGDLPAMTGFAARLHDLRRAQDAQSLPAASEACLSGAELVGQIRGRLNRLAEATRDEAPSLAVWLADRVAPAFTAAAERAEAILGGAFGQDLAAALRTLSPSDFGTHNALRTKAGLTFLDFEYFGWDDPVKLVADVLLHPAMELTASEAADFSGRCRRIYGDDAGFEVRLGALYPLYALRWAMIVLNAFLPERWARIHFATGEDEAKARRIRLDRAEGFLEIARRALPGDSPSRGFS